MKTAIFRMIKNNNVFVKGQKLFEIFCTGALASYVRGRYKKHGRWISSWIYLCDEHGKGFKGKPNAKFIGYTNLDDNFKKSIGIYIP